MRKNRLTLIVCLGFAALSCEAANSTATGSDTARAESLLEFDHRPLSAFRSDIPIQNAGFEANVQPMGCWLPLLIPTGWTVHDPAGIYDGGNDTVGVLHPLGSPHFPAGAPEGDNVALVFIGSEIGMGPMGLTQVLGDVLQPETAYTLTVEVGNIASGVALPPCDAFGFFDLDGFPGYQVQLLAGGVVVAEDNNSLAGSIPEGEFLLSTVQFTTGPTHPQLGQPLEVRLINLNQVDTPADPGIEVDFDDVRLIALPVAELPAASPWGLTTVGIIILLIGSYIHQSRRVSTKRLRAT